MCAGVPGKSATDPPVPVGEVVVYPIDGTHERTTMQLAVDLVESADGTLIVLVPVVVPDQTPLSLSEDLLAKHRKLARYVLMADVDSTVRAEGTVRVGRSYERAVADAVDDYEGSAVLLEHEGTDGLVSTLRESVFDRLGSAVDCTVVSVTGAEHRSTPASILLAVAGGPHSNAAADVARALAAPNDAWVDVYHALESDEDAARERADRAVADARDRLEPYDRLDTWIEETDDAGDAIVEQSRYYDLTVLGAPRKGRLRQFVFGSTPGTVRERGTGTIVVVNGSGGGRRGG